MEYFPQLRNWIRIFFNENKVHLQVRVILSHSFFQPRQAFHKGHNQLTTEVLRLLHYLVSYGYYSNMTDIKGLLRPMLSVMDGRDDFPFRSGLFSPFGFFLIGYIVRYLSHAQHKTKPWTITSKKRVICSVRATERS